MSGETIDVEAIVSESEVIKSKEPQVLVASPKKNCKYCNGKGTVILLKPNTFSVSKLNGDKKTIFKSPRELTPCHCLINAMNNATSKDLKLNSLKNKMKFKTTDDGVLTVVM